ncbi:MAG: hypothetical protein V2J25_13870 [Desulfatiglans sp.]|jgi:hypothetical protein|nr:hypothetical protein [Desulfatiglans sp.]
MSSKKAAKGKDNHLGTYYSTADIEQLTTRISAFIEIMRERREYVENKR